MSTVDHLENEPAPASAPAVGPAGAPGPVPTAEAAEPEPDAMPVSAHVAPWLAALRVATGFVFLWAFLDKLFGLGYAVPSEGAWLNGGSPTEGFLRSIAVGPLEETFHGWAGQPWADWLFMAGMAGVGIAVILGIGLRIAAVSGILMMALLWASQWPPAQHTSTGEPSGSNNPLVDTHVIYALALVVVAATRAGHHWGLGRRWAQLPLVRRYSAVLL